MLNTAFSPWPCYSPEEVQAVSETLASNRVNYWTGDRCREFERRFADWAGVGHAVALANGTLALDLALKALGIGPGDEVVTTPRTFIASASCIVTAGATPVFADVDADTQNITADTIRAVLTPRTRAIICVHLGGMPCDMDPIMALAREHDLKVIEDCAQAHGARYRGRSVGSIGHVGAWSFCQDKIMTTGGEGGMVTTNDLSLWSAMWSYKDHGKSWEAVYERRHPPGPRLVHDSFGTNWRMMEMQAVIGRLQLQRMPEWTQKRTEYAQRILKVFQDSPYFSVHYPNSDYVHANYKCYVQVNTAQLPEDWSRDRIMAEINALGVPCFSGSCSEVYLEHAFDGTPWRPAQRLANAQQLGESSLMFLVHPTLSEDNIRTTEQAIAQVIQRI